MDIEINIDILAVALYLDPFKSNMVYNDQNFKSSHIFIQTITNAQYKFDTTNEFNAVQSSYLYGLKFV